MPGTILSHAEEWIKWKINCTLEEEDYPSHIEKLDFNLVNVNFHFIVKTRAMIL
jgi:hypothetical protein